MKQQCMNVCKGTDMHYSFFFFCGLKATFSKMKVRLVEFTIYLIESVCLNHGMWITSLFVGLKCRDFTPSPGHTRSPGHHVKMWYTRIHAMELVWEWPCVQFPQISWWFRSNIIIVSRDCQSQTSLLAAMSLKLKHMKGNVCSIRT